jgi:hypothetical protein
MNIQKAANLAAVGQVRPQKSIMQLSTLLAVAEVSIVMVAAEVAARSARDKYECKIRQFERVHGRLGCGISRSKPEHADAIAYTAEAYDRYRLAKRQIYNAKRRLLTAVRRAQESAQ